MVAPVIFILFDLSKESVGSRSLRVILFGAITTIIPKGPIVPVDPLVAPEVGTVSVISLAGVLDFVDYSSFSDSDPTEDSLLFVPDLPLALPLGSSSHDTLTPSLEFPLTPIVAPPEIHRRKRVGPIPARRLSWRCVSHHSSDRHSSPDSSSSRSPSDHSLSRRTPPDTTDADSSTPQRFVHHLRGQVVNQMVVTCYEFGRQGHYRSDCPNLKDQYRANKARNKNGVGEAKGKAYVLGGGDANPDFISRDFIKVMVIQYS
nr:hypothetical protein [Tanacetum cinerariifolium]